MKGVESLSREKVMGMVPEKHHDTVLKWLDRGDGIAVYQNLALDSADMGHKQFLSFGSDEAQLEVDDPPTRLPDIGGSINWRYSLIGIHR